MLEVIHVHHEEVQRAVGVTAVVGQFAFQIPQRHDAVDDAGNAVGDVIDDAGNAVEDVAHGAGDVVDDLTGDNNP